MDVLAASDGGSRIADGTLRCGCRAAYPIVRELLDLRTRTGDDAEEQKRQQERFFSDEAESYEHDVVNSSFYRALDEVTVHRWGRQLPKGSRVVDVGSGTGRVAIRLAQHGHQVIALDLTEPLLRRAQEKARAAGVVNSIDFVLADAEEMPVVDGAVDAAAAHGVLHHVARPAAVIAGVARAIRPGGHWFSLDPNRTPLRGLFDATMRWRRLWREEAAPDGLQTEGDLTTWCDAAGIAPRVGYSCYLPPHLVLLLPERLTRPVLDLSDALFRRSIARRLAGVIVVAGRKRPVADVPRRSESRHALLVRAALLVLLAFASGVWRADPDVAAKSSSYYMNNLEYMLEVANAPSRFGATMLYPNGGLLEEGSLDDVGYALVIQLLALGGLHVTAERLANLHAAGFVAGALLFAWAVGSRYRSTLAAVAVLVALLALASRLSMLIYGQVSNQTSTSLLPPLVLPALLTWTAALTAVGWANVRSAAAEHRRPSYALAASMLLGVLVGIIDLIRHSHGLAVMLALAMIVLVGMRGLRTRGAVTTALVVGYLVAATVLPAGLKIQRDVHLGRWHGWAWTYLQRPPAHHIYYTLLTAVGRYPNSLGLFYEDRSVDQYIRRATPHELETVRELVDASAPLFVQYVQRYPREYASYLVRGTVELVPFVAYTTFMAPKQWVNAWPTIVPGMQVDGRDVARYGKEQLMNVRFSYLRLSPLQWLVYIAAWGAILGGAATVLVSRDPSQLLIGAAIAYLAMVAWPRALIPVQGMDFVIAFWCTALLCGAHLVFGGPAHPLAEET